MQQKITTLDEILTRISSGQYKSIHAIKTCSVTCRDAIPGEKVTTLVDNGTFVETQNTVPMSGEFVVVSNVLKNQDGVHVNSSYVSKAKFEKLYKKIGGTDQYRPTSGVKTVHMVNEAISFNAPWGETLHLKSGGVLVPDGDGFYGINPLEFNSTYSRSESLELPILMPNGVKMSSALLSHFGQTNAFIPSATVKPRTKEEDGLSPVSSALASRLGM